MGAYSYAQDPSNEYVLTTSRTGWIKLTEFWSTSKQELYQGPILQNSVLAENFTDKSFFSNFGRIFTQKQRIQNYLSNMGSYFIVKGR
jgi:hypothetical protein